MDLEYSFKFVHNYITELKKNDVIESDFSKIINHAVFADQKHVFFNVSNEFEETDLSDFILKKVHKILKHYIRENDLLKELVKFLIFGMVSLQNFVQSNWLGPYTKESGYEPNLDKLAMDYFSCNFDLKHNIYSPFLLMIAKVCLIDVRHIKISEQIILYDWWCFRCIKVFQLILQSPNSYLYEIFSELPLFKDFDHLLNDGEVDLYCQFSLEVVELYHTYGNSLKACELINSVCRNLNLDIKLTGILGKRTRFQQTPCAQPVVGVTFVKKDRKEENLCESIISNSNLLPKNLLLQNETLLNEVMLEKNLETVRMTPLIQVVLLGVLNNIITTSPKDDLLNDEVLAYIQLIISRPLSWCIQSSALFFRSKFECSQLKKKERAIQQLEELCTQFNRQQPPFSERLPFFYCSYSPSVHTIEHQLALFLVDIGVYGEALKLFTKLSLWDDVIKCYIRMGKSDAARNVVQQELKKNESPMLLCYFGNLQNDPTYYEKAWKLSKSKYFPAQVLLAQHQMNKKHYEEALISFEKALSLNRLQLKIWFQYGCCALLCKKYEIAAKAFHRCVNIEYDNYEAWSNLATCYIRLNQKNRAFKLLQEAIKCNYEDYRLWENLLPLSIDTGHFNQSIKCYQRLLELKKSLFVDNEILSILVRFATENNIIDADGNTGSKCVTDVRKLFGQIASKVPNDSKFWKLYSDLLYKNAKRTDTDLEQSFSFYNKAIHVLLRSKDWPSSSLIRKEVCEMYVELSDRHLLHCDRKSGMDENKIRNILMSAKLDLRRTLTVMQKFDMNIESKDLFDKLSSQYDSMEAFISATQMSDT